MNEPTIALRRPPQSFPPAATAAIVCGFWWLATGLAFAMRLDDRSRAIAGVVATLLAGVGAYLVAATRRSRTPVSALGAFFGAALLWGWVSILFFGGWVTGLPSAVPAAPPGSAALAIEAMAATFYSDLLGVFVIALVALATVRAPNRVALATLALFWFAHQLARLNLFAGVRQPAGVLLPERLSYLQGFFGPAHNSPLVFISISGFAALTIWLGVCAARAREPYARHRLFALGVLAGLATIEHVALAVPATLPLWSAFLPRS